MIDTTPSPPAWILEDVLAPALRAVFCGTAASTVSAARRAYYAGPGNAFWPTLHAVGLIPRVLAPEDYRLLPTFGFGVTDLVKSRAGGDRQLQAADFDVARVRTQIMRVQPAVLAFTSKRAAQIYLSHAVSYGLQPERTGNSRLFVLCSPSGAARASWDLGVWQEFSRLIQALPPAGASR